METPQVSDQIILGAAGNDPLAIDLDRLIGTHLCIIGNSGAGKSGAIRRLLEETHGKIQHIVLDGEDEFYTLRERFDYVIAGGDDGDTPANLDNAAALARATLEHGFSLVAQLNDLGDDAAAFVGAFLEALIGAPRELWRPVLIVVDEAQRYVPVSGSTDGTEGVKALLQRGRKRGFTAVLASLAMSEINPRVRGLCNNWMLGRVGQALDRDTVAKQLGFRPSSEEARGLQTLAPRHFWCFGPALSPAPTLVRISDVATTPVRPGQAKVATPPPPEALRAILSGLAVKPQQDGAPLSGEGAKSAEAGHAASYERLMRESGERIAALEAENRSLRAGWALREERLLAFEATVERARSEVRGLAELLASLPDQDESEAEQGGPDEVTDNSVKPEETRRPATDAPAAGRREPAVTPGEPSLSPAEQEILDALLWCDALYRKREHDRHIVAALVGNHARTKGFLNRLGALRSAGLLDYGSGTLFLTEAGYERANTPDIEPTVESARAAVKRILTKRQADILDMVIHQPHSRSYIAERLGLHERTKGFLNDLGRLRGLKFVDYHPNSTVRAEPFLRDAPQ